MRKVVCKDINEKGVNLTLYDPRNKFGNINFSYRLETQETQLRKEDTRLTFSHCITSIQKK